MPNPFYIWNPATKFVIDIAEGGSGAKPTAGRMLDAYTKKTSAPQNANQLWTYVPVTAAGFENAVLAHESLDRTVHRDQPEEQ